MLSKYFQDELAYLRDMGRAFGLAHPAFAGMLAERGGDPDVERLLEGFAFLTARIRERTEDALPEVIQGLIQLLLPHYLRPVPSTSILEFSPQLRALRGRLPVPRGSQVASEPLDGTACTFRTAADVSLVPVQLLETSLESVTSTSAVLRVALQTTEQGKREVFKEEGLRFFLHGELPLTSTLKFWLFRHCRAIRVRGSGKEKTEVVLAPTALRDPSFEDAEALLPWPELSPRGFRLLQEYFTLPQKFLFFELRGLEAAAATSGDRFELLFDFDRPPPLPARVGRDVLKLHCVPVVNLFGCDADPLRLDSPQQEHLLRASGVDPRYMEVFTVDEVVGVRAGARERESYAPFVDFAHLRTKGAFHQVRRAHSTVSDGWDTYLSLSTARDVLPSLEPETLSVSLTCSNRNLAAQVRTGDLRRSTPSSPALATFTNIVPVSLPVRPPLGTPLHWQLLSHLSLNQRSLLHPGALQAVLGLYNFQAHGDAAAARGNTLRLEAIKGARATAVRRYLQNAAVRGQRTVVELEERGFSGIGDAFLFGDVLDRVFADHLTLNAFHELALELNPSRLEMTWPPRSGTQSLV